MRKVVIDTNGVISGAIKQRYLSGQSHIMLCLSIRRQSHKAIAHTLSMCGRMQMFRATMKSE